MRVLRRTLDDAAFGFAVFDADLRFSYIKPLLGRDPRPGGRRPHLGRRMGELFPADHVIPVLPAVEQVLRTRDVHRDVDMPLHVDGVERHFTVHRHPLRRDGLIVGVVVFVHDRTTQRRHADLTAHARDALAGRSAAAGPGPASARVDLRTGSLSWKGDTTALFGAQRAPETVDHALRLVHPDQQQVARSRLARLRAGESLTAETHVLRADGVELDALMRADPMLDGDGAVVAAQITVLDMTAQRSGERIARRARAQHEDLVRLQQALLPTDLPETDGLTVAVGYSSSGATTIGGDFYDVFRLPDRSTGLVVGDVTGHDISAATTMAHVRTALRAYAIEDPLPGRALARTNTFVTTSDLALTSAVYAVYEPRRATVTLSNAGHPPPLLIHEGTCAYVTGGHGTILGVHSAPHACPTRPSRSPGPRRWCSSPMVSSSAAAKRSTADWTASPNSSPEPTAPTT